MAIASGASDGIRADSAAKESVGNASTLGSQTAAAANEVIVPDAITANNEGNLASTPTYVGRMIAIRPWEMRLAKVPTVQAGGSGYAVSDTIDLNGVAGVTGAPVLTVTAVNAGAVTAVEITEADGVEIRRQGMTSAPSPADNPVGQAATSGLGTSATFNCIWEPHFEIRFCTADATNTLTVHEPWDTPPVSGDNWAVSYILDDYATLTGCTLRAQSGVFEFSRRCKVGPLTDGTRRGWLAINDGKQMELDNLASGNAFETANGSIFTVGYLQGGESVNGGYVSTSGTGQPAMRVNDIEGAIVYCHDFQIRSPREQLIFSGVDGGPSDADEVKWYREVKNIIRNWKFFDVGQMTQSGFRLEQGTLQQSATATQPANSISNEGGDGPGIAQVNGLIWISNEATTTGYRCASDNTSAEIIEGLRNITFLFPELSEYITLDDDEIWRFVNPVWDMHTNLVNRVDHQFGFTGEPSIEELMSLVVRPVTAAGVGVSGVHGYIYAARRFSEILAIDNTNQSDSAAYDPVALDDFRFELDIEAGDIAYFSDLLVRVWDGLIGNGGTGSGEFIAEERRSAFAWRGYDYGNVPVTIPITLNFQGGVDTQAVFLTDTAITEASQATALTNPTTNPTVIRHGLLETDTRPMKALNYDAGTLGTPAVGVTVTQGSATGDVLEVLGSGVSGTLLLENWNGTEFTDGQTITGTGFSATTDLIGGTGFYEEYTWEVNAQGEAMTIVYDYLAARMAEATLVSPFDDVIVWGNGEPDANQLLFFGADGYFTNRALQPQIGRFVRPTPDFTDDFNRATEDLDVSANWDTTGAGSDNRVVNNAVTSVAAVGDGGTNTVAVATHDFADDQYVQFEIAVLSSTTAGSWYGAVLRHGTDGHYGFMLEAATASADRFRITKGTADDEIGEVLAFGNLSSSAVAGDIVICVARGNQLSMFRESADGERWELMARAVDDDLTSGQPGIKAVSNVSNPAWRINDFEAGEVVDADRLGEGVWIHDRGTGDLDFMTSDDGTQYVPAATVTLRVEGVTEGTPVSIIAAETSGSVTEGDVLMEQFADSDGVAELAGFIYEAAFGAGLDVNIRARNQGVAVAAIADDGGVFTDETTEAAEPTASDMSLTPSGGYTIGDNYYFGHSEQFSRIKLNASQTWGAFVKTATLQYWDGLTWTNLTVEVQYNDGTTSAFAGNLTNAPLGDRIVEWTIPGDWAATTVNSQGPMYFVRWNIGVTGGSAQALGTLVSIDATRYFPWPQTGVVRRTITSAGLTAVAVWVEDTISTFKSSDFA